MSYKAQRLVKWRIQGSHFREGSHLKNSDVKFAQSYESKILLTCELNGVDISKVDETLRKESHVKAEVEVAQAPEPAADTTADRLLKILQQLAQYLFKMNKKLPEL